MVSSMHFPAAFFTIVGAAYIPERHLATDCNVKGWTTRRYGRGLPWLARDFDLRHVGAAEMDQACSEILK